ncbi:hypothetical protein F5Y10DRAFT_259522 [Nemania abortiva]|nr:hypothetical protein F5Y10DRAFT_259522 [Nemania abortiva]
MAFNLGFLLFVLRATSVVPVLGRSTTPFAREQAALEQSIVQKYSGVSSLPPEHVFYANSQVNFSWEDPGLQRRLWSGQPRTAPEGLMPTSTVKRHVQKRAKPHVLGTLFKIPSCLGCARAQFHGITGTLDELTVMYLEMVLLKSDQELYNTCLFYTSVWDETDEGRIGKLRPLGFLGKTPDNLSKPATDYGCMNGLYTIWNCYSGRNAITGASDDPRQYNYWEVKVEGSWLYNGLFDENRPDNLKVGNQDRVRQYFENMSEAFAKHCGGTIRVFSLDPTNLAKYGYIWGTKELPALRANLNSPYAYAPTNLIAIDATKPTLQYNIDWNTLKEISQLSEEDELYYDPAKLSRRDTCDSNVAYQTDGQDWFG